MNHRASNFDIFLSGGPANLTVCRRQKLRIKAEKNPGRSPARAGGEILQFSLPSFSELPARGSV